MPEPAPGTVRVFAHAAVRGVPARSWGDVPGDEQTLALFARGILSLEGPEGEPPPADIPPRRCCGG